MKQDTEPDPGGGGGVRITQGVADDRVISISDREMRHGRKSRSVRIDGCKRHITVANGLILSTAVEPANVREREPTERMLAEAPRFAARMTSDSPMAGPRSRDAPPSTWPAKARHNSKKR